MKRSIEELAEWIHNEYEKASKKVGWDTQKSCKVKFKDLPEENKLVMLLVADKIGKLLRDVNEDGLRNCYVVYEREVPNKKSIKEKPCG